MSALDRTRSNDAAAGNIDLVDDVAISPRGSEEKRAITRKLRSFSWSKLTESVKGRARSKSSSDTPPLTPQDRTSRLRGSSVPTVNEDERESGTLVAPFSDSSATAHDRHVPATQTDAKSSLEGRQCGALIEAKAQETNLPSATSRTLDSRTIAHRSLEARVIAEGHIQPRSDTTSGGPDTISRMESARLQPPASVGTKGRAIQQAKEMELLVAARAKRSGDEPPPYDFFELIGKGAYGRVFKGYNAPFAR